MGNKVTTQQCPVKSLAECPIKSLTQQHSLEMERFMQIDRISTRISHSIDTISLSDLLNLPLNRASLLQLTSNDDIPFLFQLIKIFKKIPGNVKFYNNVIDVVKTSFTFDDVELQFEKQTLLDLCIRYAALFTEQNILMKLFWVMVDIPHVKDHLHTCHVHVISFLCQRCANCDDMSIVSKILAMPFSRNIATQNFLHTIRSANLKLYILQNPNGWDLFHVNSLGESVLDSFAKDGGRQMVKFFKHQWIIHWHPLYLKELDCHLIPPLAVMVMDYIDDAQNLQTVTPITTSTSSSS